MKSRQAATDWDRPTVRAGLRSFSGGNLVIPENRLLDALLHEALAPIEAQELAAAE